MRTIYSPICFAFSLFLLQQTKMRHDVATGVIEMVLDHFTQENEGTYAVQIQDGTGKAQSSLVLIGDGEVICTFPTPQFISHTWDFLLEFGFNPNFFFLFF